MAYIPPNKRPGYKANTKPSNEASINDTYYIPKTPESKPPLRESNYTPMLEEDDMNKTFIRKRPEPKKESRRVQFNLTPEEEQAPEQHSKEYYYPINKQDSYRGYHGCMGNKTGYEEELERKLKLSKDTERELNYQNQKLISTIDLQAKEIEQLKAKLAWHESKDPKVSIEEYNKLKQNFDNYKSSASAELKRYKEKATNYDEMERKYLREAKQHEEDMKHAQADVNRYKSSIDSLNARIATLKKSQVIKLAPAEEQPKPTNEPPKTIEDPNMIPDDWKNIIQAVDYILEQDTKAMKRAGFNLPALKLTRELLKSHQ